MFIEVLAEDGKSGLINENEVMAIQPNSFDDKAKLVLASTDNKGSKLALYSALPYATLVRRLTAHTVSVAIEDAQPRYDESNLPSVESINPATVCGQCGHAFDMHNEDDGCMHIIGFSVNKTLASQTPKYCECREFVIKENPAVAN